MVKEKIGAIYHTDCYEMFKTLPGNRVDAELRAKALIPKLKEFGQLEPITVNERMEVIDGQARLSALKSLKMPVEYRIKAGIGYEECIVMNTSQKNWKIEDYIKSYASMGMPSYRYLLALKTQFPKLSYSMLASIARRSVNTGGYTSAIRLGKLSISQSEYEDAIQVSNYIYSIRDNFPAGGQSILNYTMAVSVVYWFQEVDKVRLGKALKEYSYILKPSATAKDAIMYLDDCYNYCLKYKVHIQELFRNYLEGKNG